MTWRLWTTATRRKSSRIFAAAAVAGAAALPVPDVGEDVLDLGTLAQAGAPGRDLVALAQLGEQRLVGMNATLRPDRLAVQRCAAGRPRRCLGEVHDLARLEGHGHSDRAGQPAPTRKGISARKGGEDEDTLPSPGR
jgi:hypothetical protein